MKILVCTSIVPDTTTKVRLINDFKNVDTKDIQWIINPWDELALTRALELKDDASKGIQSVTVAHAGPANNEPVIRKALAIGADDAIRVNAEPSDAYATAAYLAEAVRAENFDIILCGIESSDHNGSTVGGMLAEFLDYPSVSSVSHIDMVAGQPVLTRELEGSREVLTLPSPFVAIVQKGIANEPRIAAMRGIMMARSKPLKVVEPGTIDSLSEVVSYEIPEPRAACRYIEADLAEQLISILHEEAKVI